MREKKTRHVFDDIRHRKHRSLTGRIYEDLRSPAILDLTPTLLKKYPLMIVGSIVVVALAAFFGTSFFSTKAEVTDFYPSTCLGTWQNPGNAAGMPQNLSIGFASSTFVASNSAIFDAPNTQIFCGGFLPQNFQPTGQLTRVGITFLWNVVGGTEAATVTASTTVPTGTASSSPDIAPPVVPSATDPSSTTSFLFPFVLRAFADTTSTASAESTTPAPAPATVPVPDPVATSPAPTPASATTGSAVSAPPPDSVAGPSPVVSAAPTSSAAPSAATTSLPSITTSTTPRVGTVSETASTSPSPSSSAPIVLGPPLRADLAPTSATGTAPVNTMVPGVTATGSATEASSSAGFATTSVALPPAPVPDSNFMEVSYSVDGMNWILLGKINLSNWQDFTISVPVRNWSDLQKLQIKVSDIPTTLTQLPQVFLDGMFVEAHYTVSPSVGTGTTASSQSTEPVPGAPPVIVPVSRSNAPVPVSGNPDFGANEAPSFNFNLNALPTSSVPAPATMDSVSSAATSGTSTDLAAPSSSVSSSVPLPVLVPPPPETSVTTSPATGFLPQVRRIFASAAHFFLAALPTGDRAFAQSASAPLPTERNPIVAEILDSDGNVTSLQPTFVVAGSDLRIILPKPGRAFRPGAYSLELWVWQNGTVYYSESPFTWGVLAVNFDKSIYTTGNTVHMGFAVLTSQGNTVCDAPITATVTSPSGKIFRFSTVDGTIAPNPTCGPQTVTDAPDYAATMPASEAGTYAVTVATQTGIGSRTLSDSFEVQAAPAFDVSRTAPTRIYPPDPYTVTIHITANQNYTGPITETIPSSFQVIPQTFARKSFSGDAQTLSWNVNLKKGDALNLSYSFLAPDISPQMYLLGPLTIGSWQEARQWQIAADAVSVVFITSTASTTWTVPADWNNSSNTIELIGGGGGGGSGATAQGDGGGGAGAGAYARITDFATTPGATIKLQVGGGGGSAAAGEISFFNWNGSGATSTCSGTTMSACAAAGAGGTTAVSGIGAGGAGGLTTASVGSVTYAGGGGGNGGNTGGQTGGAGGGGGGAAGPSAGGNAGTLGSAATAGPGGQGDGTAGGAGGAADTAGSNGTEWSTSPAYGAGGGGGGATGGAKGRPGTAGGAGGTYGAGGGGGSGGGRNGGAGGAGGIGTQGIIVITYTPAATGPTISNVSLNGGTAITLTAATTTTITLTASTTANGNPISSASAVVYRTSLGPGCSLAMNDLDCYKISSSSCAFSGASTTVTCSVALWYFAQATDASSSYPADSWSGTLTVADSGGGAASSTSAGVTLNTLLAINVTPTSMNYGTLTPGSNTGSTDQTEVVANVGNSSSTLDLSGTALTGSGGSIATSSQHYATSSFAFGGTESQLSDIPSAISGFLLSAPTSTGGTQGTTYWGIQVPSGFPTGTYTSTITFTGVFHS